MSDILNVTIDPILPDINYMVKNHIECCVRKFNKQFIRAQIDDHKQKIKELEKQLEILDEQAYEFVTTMSSDDEAAHNSINSVEPQQQQQQENIKLSINEIDDTVECDSSIKVIRTESNYFTQTDMNDGIVDGELSKSPHPEDDDLYGDNDEQTNELDNVTQGVPVCVDTFEQFRADKQIPTHSSEDLNNIIPSNVVSQENDTSYDQESEGQCEEEEEEEEEQEEGDDEEIVGVFEIEIDEETYFTTDEKNGTLYNIDEDGEPGIEVGKLQNGIPVFNKIVSQ